MLESARHLPLTGQPKFLLSKVGKAERLVAAQDRYLLDLKFAIARSLWARMRDIGATDAEADVLHAWEMTRGTFWEHFSDFLDKLSFASSHQKLSAYEHAGDLRPVLKDLARRAHETEHNRRQGAILAHTRKSLLMLIRYQRRLADGYELQDGRVQDLIGRLTHSFPGVDWPSYLPSPRAQ
jgi:hypothetical protein